MDLNQRKLTKSEWGATEVPVSSEEKEILNLIMRGYNNVNIKYNKNVSLFGYLKIEYTELLEDYLYNKYFSEKIGEIKKGIKNFEFFEKDVEKCFNITIKPNVTIKKVDSIRMDQNDLTKVNSSTVFEYLLIELLETVVKKWKNADWLLDYFTLHKLSKVSIANVNRHISGIIQKVLLMMDEQIPFYMSKIISNSVELIEKNQILLKYSDLTLYEHQKQLFTAVKNEGPKLILYIAPTGTGKTLSPIGLSEEKRVIFVCAARHVGLALAKSAISVNKKIAVAFGCGSSADIRLHYFAAKDYSINKRTGGIGKVDNSNGEKVEIIICDIKSFLPSMYYMTAFNCPEDIIVYWDEPTITMDYENHDLHEIIKRNWKENVVPNMILSSATLPKLHELTETIGGFKDKFREAQIYNIVSHDCKKSIPIINKNGFVVLPHYISEDYETVLRCVEHCEENLTLLRYFDLKEVVEFISLINASQENSIAKYFHSIDDVTMQSIKLHYLYCIKKLGVDKWSLFFRILKDKREKRIKMNTIVDEKGNKIRKTVSIGPGVTLDKNEGKPLMRLASEQLIPTKKDVEEQPGIYITTKDAFTLTDGPTIFLANDVEKIAKFCIQQANIPEKTMEDILQKIEYNNAINEKIAILEKDLEDILQREVNNNESTSIGGKKKEPSKTRELMQENGKKTLKIETDLERLRAMIKTCQLNETFIPNKPLHISKWAESLAPPNVFTSDIDESTMIDIMLLKDVNHSWKVLLMMGIGVFTNHPSIAYTEIMKKLADQQKLFVIIASSDYIYGTNYQFCHGYLSKDMSSTQEKIIQALGRIGRNNIQQNYSIRFRDDEQITKLFFKEDDKIEVKNMNLLFS